MAKTLTIDLEEYLALSQARKDADARCVDLEQQLINAKMGNTDDLARKMIVAFRGALEVTKYAIGHLSPEFARKWPAAALEDVAKGIREMPDASCYELETILVIESFLRDITHWNANRDESYKVPPPSTILHAESGSAQITSRAAGSLKTAP